MINFQDFQKIELRIGTILAAEPIVGSEKLLKLSVDFGEVAPRQVISSIAKTYKPTSLVGRQFLFVTNLEPRMIMGLESQAMILATENAKGRLVLVKPSKKIAPGSSLH